ncbi:MAG: hypothetical protein K2H52_04740 [Lachnospiraceae bacterium]|nr:hypothetical protein [Lachnospiraceae bacterium]
MENLTKFNYSERISEKRKMGKADDAIDIALQAKERYPEENIFEKLLGDIYFQEKRYELAGTAYINFLKKIGNKIQYVKHFAYFMQRYSEIVEREVVEEYCHKVEEGIDSGGIDKFVIPSVCEILSRYVEPFKIEFFQDDNHFKSAVGYLSELEGSCQLYILYYKILSLKHSERNKRIDKYVVSSMERKEMYREALQLIEKVLNYDRDQVAVRTLFRICRKLNDYSSAERYILNHPEIKSQENFNVLYEMVFYYSKIGDIEERNETLKKIEKCGNNSVPIMRTLYNFYLQFGMLDKAVAVTNKIASLNQSYKEKSERKQQEEDAALALLVVIKELFEELEHSRKLISMSELLKGFSHELGQPITNIRYGVQLYQMKMQKGVNTQDELVELFDDILSQTFRIKKLLSRFSPVVNEKENMIEFNVAEEVKNVFNEFVSRLEKENIEWKVLENADFVLYGDHVKFDQIFYNLIGNSIYAINERGIKGNIAVSIKEEDNSYFIIFEDNGIGIASEYLDKIFEPFFTTKDHTLEENGGGEGLGLYIVWNIVQMFGGTIKVDKQFVNGARFIIEISKKEKRRSEDE